MVKRQKDEARRDTRRRFEQWVQNPRCEANTVSAVHGIQMAAVVKHEGGRPTMGQSQFAIARGHQFERTLFKRDATVLINALIKSGILPTGSSGLADYRLRIHGGRCKTLDEARTQTASLLKSAVENIARTPAVIAGATVSIPGGVMLPEALLVIDAIAIRPGADKPELIVGEIKTYPDRGGHTDTRQLSTARAQAGVYVHALQLVVKDLELTEAVAIQQKGFLVLSRPGSNQPSIRAGEDLHYQTERARTGFQLLRDAAEKLPQIKDQSAESSLEAVCKAEVFYQETCLSFCDRASVCRQRSTENGEGSVLGNDMVRFLGATSLHRAVQLLDGATPTSETERDLLRRITDARQRIGLS